MHAETLSFRRSGSDMVRWIEHIREPKKLTLVWQAPDEKNHRTRLVVGEIVRHESEFGFRYHRNTPDVAKAKELSYQGYPAFNIQQDLHTRDVLPAFLRRLPPRTRPDFHEYLRGLRIKPGAEISDFALLGYSEAKLPGDGFSLVDTLEDAQAPAEFLLEVAGYRYHTPALLPDVIGRKVDLVPEPTNQYDRDAIQVMLDGRRIGYINRLQAPSVSNWLSSARISGFIEKLNGRADWPRAYIFVEIG